jgi:choline dehydrogenase-like flavoprotein
VIRDIRAVASSRIDTDVCVIGSGAAGLTLARELDGTGARVTLLEGGRRQYDERAQDLYQSDLLGLVHRGVHTYRYRMFGGATTRWAGQALPLFDLDFESRPWVADSGWPVDRDELDPYYRRAAEAMGIHPFSRNGSWPSALPAPPAFDPQLLLPLYTQFAARPNFAERFGPGLEGSRNVDVVLGANVAELVTDRVGSEVALARARGLDGERLDVRASLFVVCAGGIDSARILLASDRHIDGGIGNGTGLVGRFFQDHPGIEVGPIAAFDARAVRDAFRPRRSGGIKFQPMFRLAPRTLRDERLLSSSGVVLFHTSQSASIDSGKLLLRSLRRRELRAQAGAAARVALREPMPLVRAFARFAVLRQPALDSTARPVLAVGCEQAPNRDSRVLLSDRRDAVGMRRVALDWRLGEAEIRAWRRSAEIAAGELGRTGLGHLDLDSFRIPDDPDQLSGIAVDIGHHIGTTRMGASADTGVVDRECRVHEIDNLYVASSSVFPTGGFSNPTLTIIALAIRVADTIKRRLA